MLTLHAYSSVGRPLAITHRLKLSPVEVTGYSHKAKCPLTVRPCRAALAGPMGCFNNDDWLLQFYVIEFPISRRLCLLLGRMWCVRKNLPPKSPKATAGYTTDRGGYPQEIKLRMSAEVVDSEGLDISRSQTDQSVDILQRLDIGRYSGPYTWCPFLPSFLFLFPLRSIHATNKSILGLFVIHVHEWLSNEKWDLVL